MPRPALTRMHLAIVLISLLGFSAVQSYPSQQLHNPYGSATAPAGGAAAAAGAYQIPGTDNTSSSNRVISMLLKEQCMRLMQEAGLSSLPDYCYYILSGTQVSISQLSYMYLQNSVNNSD